MNSTRSRSRSAFARVGSIELDGDPVWAEAQFVGGVKRLPIRYTLR